MKIFVEHPVSYRIQTFRSLEKSLNSGPIIRKALKRGGVSTEIIERIPINISVLPPKLEISYSGKIDQGNGFRSHNNHD